MAPAVSTTSTKSTVDMRISRDVSTPSVPISPAKTNMPMQAGIKNILFDLGGVLIDLDTSRSIRAFAALIADDADAPISAMDLLGGGESELVQQYQVGAISSDTFFGELKKAGYHIYILSNINEDHVHWTLEHFREWGIEVGRDIDQVFFSNEMHLAKPDIRCYEQVIRSTGINPAETLYIDDLPQNIEAGKRVGFITLQALGDAWLPVL